MKKYILFFVLLSIFSCNESSKSEISIPSEGVTDENPIIDQNKKLVLDEIPGIVFDGNLRLREYPFLDSNTIATIPNNAEVQIIARTKTKQIIDEIEQYWYKIIYNDVVGWSFGGYIRIENENNIELLSINSESPDFGLFIGKSFNDYIHDHIAIKISNVKNDTYSIQIGEIINNSIKYFSLNEVENEIRINNADEISIFGKQKLTDGYDIVNEDSSLWIEYEISIDKRNHYNSYLLLTFNFMQLSLENKYQINRSSTMLPTMKIDYEITDKEAYQFNLYNPNSRGFSMQLLATEIEDYTEFNLTDTLTEGTDYDTNAFYYDDELSIVKGIENGRIEIDLRKFGSKYIGTTLLLSRPEMDYFITTLDLY